MYPGRYHEAHRGIPGRYHEAHRGIPGMYTPVGERHARYVHNGGREACPLCTRAIMVGRELCPLWYRAIMGGRELCPLCTPVYPGGKRAMPAMYTRGTMVGIHHLVYMPGYVSLGTPPGPHSRCRLQCRCITGSEVCREEALGSVREVYPGWVRLNVLKFPKV